jgi:hypothetical protein
VTQEERLNNECDVDNLKDGKDPVDDCSDSLQAEKVQGIEEESETNTYVMNVTIIAKHLNNLKRHKLSQHEGVKYSCDECSHKSFTPMHLPSEYLKKKH